jgi:hypothetical protein
MALANTVAYYHTAIIKAIKGWCIGSRLCLCSKFTERLFLTNLILHLQTKLDWGCIQQVSYSLRKH